MISVSNIGFSFTLDGARHELLVGFTEPSLFPGIGLHGLRFTATANRHDLPGASLLLRGDSTVVAPGGHTRAWLGTVTHVEPMYLRDNGITSDCQLMIGVSDEQLWRIEDLRSGDDFQLDLRLHATLVREGRTFPMINAEQHQVRVDRALWLRRLTDIQRAAHFTVAVPALGDTAGGMASVVKFLREAEVAYRDNRDRDAATAVRKALERFSTLITIPSTANIDDTRRSQRDERQRWAAVYHGLMGVLNAAPHGDHVTEKVEFGRRDGQAVIAIAMALIGRDWD
jgi:hypothetical protein